ncbi:hypothetical protein BIZ71_gp60 [Gordonia phage Hedwig]|uniref:Uncharacterized protein n=1 Tax=Gordonia phage Hedwig TaxID=1887648 RepID=A0A1C9EHS4_9CAUD|nr:hypothetical protein BIZ71_gp60 [Gordonia phage Hedwig]AON97353.1 hypothetical protein SEA_HEDWIG_60 [Gordonia phage Hedwig]
MTDHPIVTTVEELQELPERTVIRSEEVREGGRRDHVIGRYFEKHSARRNEWLELNPSDRFDGEETVDAALIVQYYAANGRCLVLWQPEAGDRG